MFAFYKSFKPLTVVLIVLFLSACGGSSGGGSSGGGESAQGPAGPDPDPETYIVTGTTGDGGTISPTSQTVTKGDQTTFTVTPDTGFSIETVSGCGGNLDGNEYTTAPITAECTVSGTFATVAELLSGKYEGVMVSPKNIFFTDSTSITFDIEGFDADITKDAFEGRTCLLEGALNGSAFPLSGSGTFECSDFTEGTWASDAIYKTNAHASLSEIEMTSGSDVYTIKVAGFRGTPPPNYDSDLDFSLPDVALDQFLGAYDGRLQTLDECAASTFANSPTDLTITIDNNNIFLEQDAFFEGVCQFEGEVDSFQDGVITASGDYQCANFDEGTWTSDRLVMTGDDSMFAEILVDVPARGCSYAVRYLGFKDLSADPIDPDPIDPDPIDPDPIEPETTTLESCNFLGCQNVNLPFNQTASISPTVTPVPEWYSLGEFRLTAGEEEVLISNVRAEVISGNAEAARITGLSEGALAAGETVEFELQSTRSTTSSIIEFAFDIDEIPGTPNTFFSTVTVTTN